MASDNTQKQPTTILAGSSGGGTVEGGVNPSNILLGTDRLRNFLQSRNLYTPNVQYPDRSPNANLISAIDGVINTIAPFKSFNIENSVFGRLAGDRTPLTEIGTAMLAQQFALNSKSQIAQQFFPTIKLSNLFDGNKDTNLFTRNVDLKISKKRRDTFAQKFATVVDQFVFDANQSNEYPFDKDANNAEFLELTGDGQLNFLYSTLNRNIYKSDDATLISIGDDIKKPIEPRSTLIALGVKTYFNFSDGNLHPYLTFRPTFFAEIPANQAMIATYNVTPDIQEYAPNADYVNEYFGKTDNFERFDLFGNFPNEWIDDELEFNSDDTSEKLVWGRNGLSDEANERLDKFRGDKNQVDNDYSSEFENGFFGESFGDLNYNKFGVKTGLLEYTRNLVNATEGRIGDITRKAYTNESNEVVAFNGSALWIANESVYAQKAGINGKSGVRQHTILDQYDRFSKAIRFNGNEVYNGNQNSVVYKSVMPRIHPTFPLNELGVPNNKNLMFSIENLALGVISKGDVGIIDDEFGSEIPICEVGPFNGRIMWFPPYNLELNETSTAKYESTVMVGRNEPMYNYQNSERTATLSFTLLMDYPENLRTYHNKTGQQKEIAEFFAFGGDPYTGVGGTEEIEKRIKDLEDEITEIEDEDVVEPNPRIPKEIKMVFPDAVPRVKDNPADPDPTDDVNTVVDLMYLKFTYEIEKGLPSNYARYGIKDVSSFGLNKAFYILSGITEVSQGVFELDKDSLPSDFSQYDQAGDCLFNNNLRDFYADEEVRKYFDVVVYGGASKLFTENDATDIEEGEEYNKELGLRRADALIELSKKRLEAIFEKSFEDLGITVRYGGRFNDGSNGDTGASDEGGRRDNMYKKNVKEERFAAVKFERNSVKAEKKKKQLSQDEINTINTKKQEIESLKNKLQALKSRAFDCIYNERESDGAILNGFKAVSGNYFSPVFHSQTPEDFHRRLTFLQQCVRQGSAKRYDNSTGTLTAKNSVFGRQPICILRIGDFFYTKIVIDNITFDYVDSTWDMNPEGFGMQPMIANITIQMKVIGGQSLKGPIDALQNAAAFNYYANSTFTDIGLYKRPTDVANAQEEYINGILAEKRKTLENAYDDKIKTDNSNSSQNS